MVLLRGFAIIVVGLGALALAGCAPTHPSAGPTHSAVPTASSTPSPTPTPTQPTLSNLVVSPDGLGYLVPGQPVPDEPTATAVVMWNATKCVDADSGIAAGAPGSGAWLPVYPDSANFEGQAHIPFNLTPMNARTDPIGDIQIWSPELRTAQHVGVGSSLSQLQAAYAGSLAVDSADNSDVYVLTGTRGKLMFEILKGPINEGEPEGTVAWIQIIPLSVAPFHIANTDGSGPCAGA